MNRELTLFLALTKISVGNAEDLPYAPTEQEWKSLFSMANKHTIAGPLFAALDKLPAGQRPPRKVFVDWLATTEKIRHDSREATHNAIWTSKKFLQAGFRNVILKGQGNALLYPDPLLRHPGDVDVWLEGSREKIISYVRKFFPHIRIQWVEMEFPVKKGCSIEVHTIPSFMSNPFDNRRLKQYFTNHAEEMFSNPPVITEEGELRVPTTKVNMLFQLTHIYRHLFNEGIGLRQIMDYYYLLQQEKVIQYIPETALMVKKLHMERFCQALMYVLQVVFGLKEERMILPPCPQEGKFLLSEILQAGNFGHADERNHIKHSKWGNFWQKTFRNWRFITHYHREVLWNPWYRLTQFAWRKYKGYN
jgi:hypothetical protein